MRSWGRRLCLLTGIALALPACGGVVIVNFTNLPPFSFLPTSLGFTATEGGADPADQDLAMTDTGALGRGVSWTAASDQPWLTIVPDSGVTNPGDTIHLSVHVNATYQIEGWTGATSTVGAPSVRRAHSAVWAGDQMVVWSGSSATAPDNQLDDGGRYDPVSNTWIGTTSTSGMPLARHLHAGVWTGTDMVVWGGWNKLYGYFNTGGRYAPDAWSGSTSTVGAPTFREGHTAVWTGSRVIVWGGWNGVHEDTGGLYDPATDSWTGSTPTAGSPGGRQQHVAVWTGSAMVVWGGRNGPTNADCLNTGGLYDPGTDSWIGATTTTGALPARTAASAVWTGREMLVWGGDDGTGPLNTGARYDPATDTWLGALPTSGAPTVRRNHTAVWTGAKMIVWGGDDGLGASLNTGGLYQPPIPAKGQNTATITVTSTGPLGTALQVVTVTLTVN